MIGFSVNKESYTGFEFKDYNCRTHLDMRQVTLFKLLQYRQRSLFIKLTQGIDRPLIKVSIGHQTCSIYTLNLSDAQTHLFYHPWMLQLDQ